MSYFWEEYLFSREKNTFFSRIKCATSPKKTFFQLIKYNFVFNFDLNIILFRINFRKIQIQSCKIKTLDPNKICLCSHLEHVFFFFIFFTDPCLTIKCSTFSLLTVPTTTHTLLSSTFMSIFILHYLTLILQNSYLRHHCSS